MTLAEKQEKDWIDKQIARLPGTPTDAQLAEARARFAKAYPFSGGPNLGKVELSVLGVK